MGLKSESCMGDLWGKKLWGRIWGAYKHGVKHGAKPPIWVYFNVYESQPPP